MNKILPRHLLLDIRFWIFLAFICRLIGITDPPLEVAHNWRQTTVTMSARNFLELDANIFYPRIDIAGEKTGITGMEFPALNYSIYLVSLVFGYGHWYGRLINLFVSSFGLWFFFKLIRKYFSSNLAFNATFILLFSIWFTYSRKIMPDTYSMSLVLIGFYYGSNYLDKKRNFKNLFLYFLFTLLGVLSKLPSAFILVLFTPLVFSKEINTKTKIEFSIVSILTLCIIGVYYFYWVPFLTEFYGFSHFFMGKNFSQGFKEVANNLTEVFEKFYQEALQYVGFLFFIIGIFLAVKNRQTLLVYVFLLSFTGFLVIIFKSGFTFYHHSYYIIPFTPIMALIAGYSLECIKNQKMVILFLFIILTESVLNKFHDFHIKEDYKSILYLEKEMDNIGIPNDLIAINSGNVPTPMYFAHRKGWVQSNELISNANYIDSLKLKGLKYIIVLKKVFGKEIKLNYKILKQNADYTIYQP